MSIARRSDGRIIVKYKDARGRWQQRSFRDEAEARRFDGEAAFDEVENERPTLLDCVLAFLDSTTHSARVLQQYRFLLMGFDRKDGKHTEGPAEFLASRYADTLTFRDLHAVRDNCRARNLSNTTINMNVAKIKAALNWSASHDMIATNPWAKYDQLEARHKSHMGKLEDFQKIYAVLPAWMQWACRTCLALCLRPGLSELFALQWQAFNWRSRAVTVYMGKTDSTKTVYPPEEYLSEAWAKYCEDGRDGEKIVCRNRRDGQVTVGQYQQAWIHACKKTGVTMAMYAIRHIAASQMLEAGADLAAVAAQLGHANASTTGRYYLHALPRAQRAAGNTLSWCGFGAALPAAPNKNK